MQPPAAPPQGRTYAELRDTVKSVRNSLARARDTLTPLSQIAKELLELKSLQGM
jgi:hypothetical protein